MWAHRNLRLAVVVFLVVAFAIPTASATVSGEEGLIAFVSYRDGNDEIYAMESDGSNQVNLTNNPSADHSPTWSPDGRQIAFASDRDGESAIWLMDADGSDPRLLVTGAGSPDWSPDGTQLAVVGDLDDDADTPKSIWLVRVDGGEVRRVTTPEIDPVYLTTLEERPHIPIWDSEPKWHPNGDSLIFARWRQGSPSISGYSVHQLFLSDLTVTQLPYGGAQGTRLDVSPEGNWYALDSVPSTTSIGNLLLVEIDGDGLLLMGPSLFTSDPAFSPTGARLVRTYVDPAATMTRRVAILGVDGTQTLLTDVADSRNSDPAWQPLNPYPVGLVDPSSGVWHLRDASGSVSSFYYGVPGDEPFMGDWNCDGTATPGLYRSSDGYVYLRNSNTPGYADISYYFGIPGDTPLAGDFNGDGCDTVSIYRPAEARIYIINELGSDQGGLGEAEYSYLFGVNGDKPFVGDFDGDGIDTVGLHRESTGRVYYRNTNTTGVAHNDYVYGIAGDRLIADDWNKDGDDTPAVFRPGNTTHYFRFTNTPGYADAQFIWGNQDWIPASTR